jgi:hypothetical protein
MLVGNTNTLKINMLITGILSYWINLTPNEVNAYHILTEIKDKVNVKKEASNVIAQAFRYAKFKNTL